MCGISGIFSEKINDSDTLLIQIIVKAQHARGPNHQNIIKISGASSEALLGHNRLSIIDLSHNADQPMWDVSHRFALTFNGEIYNYLELRSELISLGFSFVTVSDTEVILVAFSKWGVDAFARFNGAFAFSLLDVENEKLYLVRDRFGKKPLFYYVANNALHFASSASVIAAFFNLEPNLEYVSQGVRYSVYEDGSDKTQYKKLYSVKPGQYLSCDFKKSNMHCKFVSFYDLSSRVEEKKDLLNSLTENQLLEKLFSEFQMAVNIRLRSDVPVGVSVSGGLDSSSIAAIMKKNTKSVTGFSFSHPDALESEGPLVSKLASKLDFDVHYIWPSVMEFSDAFRDTLVAQEAPFGGFSVVAQYLVYKKAAKEGVKVLLGGQGADEGLMGYKKFQIFQLQELLAKKKYFSALAFFYQLIQPFFSELQNFNTYWSNRHRYSSAHKSNSFLELPDSPCLSLNRGGDIQLRQIYDVTKFSLPTLLRYEDRNSMGNSIESRLPFMDFNLLEFCLALPTVLKLKKGYGKWCFREVAANQIPDSIRLARYKRGFDFGMSRFVNQGFGATIRSMLQEKEQVLKHFIVPGVKISEAFSDANFISRPSVSSEAINLLWLGEVYKS